MLPRRSPKSPQPPGKQGSCLRSAEGASKGGCHTAECHSEDPTPPAQEPPGVGVSPSPPSSPSEELPKLYNFSLLSPGSLVYSGCRVGKGLPVGNFQTEGRTPLPALRPWASGPCDTRLQAALHSFPWPPAQAAASARTGARPACLSLLRALPGRSPSDAHDVLHLGAEGRRGPRLAR